jgi:hypothetical protein
MSRDLRTCVTQTLNSSIVGLLGTVSVQCVDSRKSCDERVQSQESVGDGLIIALEHETQGTDQADDGRYGLPAEIAKRHFCG